MDPTVIAVLLQVSAPLLDWLEKGAIKKLTETTPVQLAAKETGQRFDEVLGCEDALLRWSDSEDFIRVLAEVREDANNVASDEELIESFTEAAKFHVSYDHESKARAVVRYFLSRLEYHLMRSMEGFALLDARGEQRQGELLSAIGSISDAVAGVSATNVTLGDEGDAGAEAAGPIHAQLDSARSLLKSGRPQSAMTILESVRTQLPTEVPARVAFRLEANAGTACLALGDASSAVQHYARALELEPTNIDVLVSCSKAYLSLDRPDRARDLSERAVAIDSSNPKALGIHLLCLYRLGDDGEAERLVQEFGPVFETPTGSAFLGEVRQSEGRYSEAIPLLRKALTSTDVELPQARTLLAVAIVNDVRHRDEARHQSSDDFGTALRDAEGLLSLAIEDLSRHESRSSYLDALASRAGVRALIGDHEGARTDCLAVLDESPRHELALQNLARIEMSSANAAAALTLLDQLPSSVDPRIDALRASALSKLDRFAEAYELASTLWDEDVEDDYQIQVADVLLGAGSQIAGSDTSQVEQRLASVWPDNPLALAIRADAADRRGETDAAASLLAHAIENSSGRLRRLLTFELAGVRYSAAQYPQAVAAYRTVEPPAIGERGFRNYLVTLLHAGFLGDVLALAAEVRRRDGITPVAEVEARVLLLIGDLAGAEQLLVQLAESDSAVEIRLELLAIRLRLGRKELAAEVLQTIALDEVSDDPNHLLALAEARQLLDLPGALDLAYRARRLAFNDPEVHQRYLGLFLNSQHVDSEILAPAVVGVGTCVHLTRPDERRVITVLDDDETSAGPDEVRSTDELGARLLGGSPNTIVTVGTGPGALDYTIEAIQSKYVYAFQETIRNFPLWFPDRDGFWRVDIEENDLSKLLLLVDEQHRASQEVIAMYRTRPIPVGLASQLLGRSIFETWSGLVGIRGEVLIASSGTDEEWDANRSTARDADALSLDATALLALAHLDLLGTVSGAYQVHTPRSLALELRSYHALHFLGARPAGVVGKQGDEYVRAEVTSETVERAEAFVKKVIRWIEEETQVTPILGALSLEPGEYAKLQATLGESSADAILIAKELKIPLLSDDLRLRAVADEVARSSVVWTLPTLATLVETGQLSREAYLNAMRALLLSNYVTIAVEASVLFDFLADMDFAVGPETTALLNAALASGTADGSLDTATELIVRLHRTSAVFGRTDALLAQILDATILAWRAPGSRLEQLAGRLQQRLTIDPVTLERIHSYLQAWAAAHYM